MQIDTTSKQIIFNELARPVNIQSHISSCKEKMHPMYFDWLLFPTKQPKTNQQNKSPKFTKTKSKTSNLWV